MCHIIMCYYAFFNVNIHYVPNGEISRTGVPPEHREDSEKILKRFCKNSEEQSEAQSDAQSEAHCDAQY